MDKENSLPIAQSTLINSLIEDAQCENRNKTLDISELPNATEDESSISSINIADLNAIPAAKIVQHAETTKTKEMPEEKISTAPALQASSQEKADLMMEYKVKYERLCGVFKQFQEQHTQLVNVFQKQVSENKESREVQQKTIFQLESDKFRLEEELQQTKDALQQTKEDNERLNERLTHVADTPTTSAPSTTTPNGECDVNTTTASSRNKSLNRSLLDVSAVIDTIKTDVRFSRSKRKSLLSNTIGIQAIDHGVDKQEFYEDIILDQQDILDFYSLLCGTSIRKTKSTFDNDEDEDDDDVDEEEDPVETEFDCKLQFEHQSLEGYPFTFNLNLKKREVRYEPCIDTVQMSQYKNHLPCILQTGITYRADDIYMFAYEIANKVSTTTAASVSSKT